MDPTDRIKITTEKMMSTFESHYTHYTVKQKSILGLLDSPKQAYKSTKVLTSKDNLGPS